MKSIKHLLDRGWYFEYDAETRFITGKHPKGGQFSVVEVVRTIHFDSDEVGHAIADMLNGEPLGMEDKVFCKHLTCDGGCKINYGAKDQRSICRVMRHGKCDKVEA